MTRRKSNGVWFERNRFNRFALPPFNSTRGSFFNYGQLSGQLLAVDLPEEDARALAALLSLESYPLAKAPASLYMAGVNARMVEAIVDFEASDDNNGHVAAPQN